MENGCQEACNPKAAVNEHQVRLLFLLPDPVPVFMEMRIPVVTKRPTLPPKRSEVNMLHCQPIVRITSFQYMVDPLTGSVNGEYPALGILVCPDG